MYHKDSQKDGIQADGHIDKNRQTDRKEREMDGQTNRNINAK